jgi:hypothetical protein
MSTKQTLILSLAAGLTGGIFSRYLAPEMVHAQTQTFAPKEISAQSFALLDAKGNRLAALTISPTGGLAIALPYQGQTAFMDPLFALEENARLKRNAMRNVNPK